MRSTAAVWAVAAVEALTMAVVSRTPATTTLTPAIDSSSHLLAEESMRAVSGSASTISIPRCGGVVPWPGCSTGQAASTRRPSGSSASTGAPSTDGAPIAVGRVRSSPVNSGACANPAVIMSPVVRSVRVRPLSASDQL
ncbi:hypothetical protein WIS52_20500 [Pseudonocardia nematodicida]|uniref:Secreted protein n=1 Tax=Pseudonocardia nematodicida TaxID=1206997 RepID=A0ABV1KEH4_9PSEU